MVKWSAALRINWYPGLWLQLLLSCSKVSLPGESSVSVSKAELTDLGLTFLPPLSEVSVRPGAPKGEKG
jgi:hypothetical protein